MAACDLSVVAPAMTFALTEVRIGVAAAVISVPILRTVSPGKIATAMFTGEPFDADYAQTIGLVTHVADDVAGHGRVLSAIRILAGSPRAIAATKRLLRDRPDPRSQRPPSPRCGRSATSCSAAPTRARAWRRSARSATRVARLSPTSAGGSRCRER